MTSTRFIPPVFAALTLGVPALAQPTSPPPAPAATVQDYTAALNALPTRESLLAYHQLLASEPHIAGTEGDQRQIDRLEKAFREMGLEVEVHRIWPLLARPVAMHVEIVEPERMTLATKEDTAGSDPFSGLPAQTPGWNAYSASGDVTASVVYANYGRKEDYAKLKELGVDLTGKIVICRYGGNFRGYKQKFAEAAGAAGVIIYTDPADSGYAKGIAYPEGTWSNSTCIERGSIDTLPYPGDPLTPGREATKDAERLDPEKIDLPRIPVQPIGYGAAAEILKRFEGPGVPDGWQGGLPFAYRVSGPGALKVRLHVEQKREVMETANVVAYLRGAEEPEKLMIIGCHHDAWGCGAADPTCGTIALMESARSFAKLAAEGRRPRRTVVFAAWAAEEFGIIGSTEWVEAHEAELVKNAVGYINLDMASMGADFGASTSPSLRWLVADCAKHVPAARNPDKTVFETWLAKGEDPLLPGWPKFGDMGGGSDHIAFLCRTGIASTSLGGSGSKGNSYHSVYDTLPWYWKTVGEDYEPALMVTRMTNAVAARMADDALIPLRPSRYGLEARRQLEDIEKKAVERGLIPKLAADQQSPFKQLYAQFAAYRERSERIENNLVQAASPATIARQNQALVQADRTWLDRAGLPARPWFLNIWAASDEDSGYAAWTLPLSRRALETKDKPEFERALEVYSNRFGLLLTLIGTLERTADDSSRSDATAPTPRTVTVHVSSQHERALANTPVLVKTTGGNWTGATDSTGSVSIPIELDERRPVSISARVFPGPASVPPDPDADWNRFRSWQSLVESYSFAREYPVVAQIGRSNYSVDIVAVPAIRVSGSVRNALGEPKAAYIRHEFEGLLTTRTEANGSFSIGGIPSGIAAEVFVCSGNVVVSVPVPPSATDVSVGTVKVPDIPGAATVDATLISTGSSEPVKRQDLLDGITLVSGDGHQIYSFAADRNGRVIGVPPIVGTPVIQPGAYWVAPGEFVASQLQMRLIRALRAGTDVARFDAVRIVLPGSSGAPVNIDAPKASRGIASIPPP